MRPFFKRSGMANTGAESPASQERRRKAMFRWLIKSMRNSTRKPFQPLTFPALGPSSKLLWRSKARAEEVDVNNNIDIDSDFMNVVNRPVTIDPSLSEPQLPQLSQSARYDGSVSITNSQMPSRTETQVERVQREMSTGAYSATSSNPSLSSSLMEPAYNPEVMLNLSNTVRQVMNEMVGAGKGRLENHLLEQLSLFIDAALSEEIRGEPTLKLETIKFAHLDKLVAEVEVFANRGFMGISPRGEKILSSEATNLQRAWRARFRTAYLELNTTRTAELVMCGGMRGVSFAVPPPADMRVESSWKAKNENDTKDIGNNLEFRVGRWWLDLACACWDGIVGHHEDRPSTGMYESAALPLLMGKEEIIDEKRGQVKYIRESKGPNPCFSLMRQTGKQLRVLRGFQLHSKYAPKGGLRYDGIWKLVRYGYKLDPDTEIFRLELTLEHIPGQLSMEEIAKFPKPSQLDLWDLYEKKEQIKIRQHFGEQGLHSWKVKREEDRREMVESERARNFTLSISAVPAHRSAMKLSMPAPVDSQGTSREGRGKRAVIDTSRNEMYLARSEGGSNMSPGHSLKYWS